MTSFGLVTLDAGEQVADVDLSTMTLEEIHHYRLELNQVLHERLEAFSDPVPTEKLRQFYIDKIQECREYIGTD